jgi:hypothetical protein
MMHGVSFCSSGLVFSRLILCVGMFVPSSDRSDRSEKCTMGVTAMLTLVVMLLIVCNLLPRGPKFSHLGLFVFGEFFL